MKEIFFSANAAVALCGWLAWTIIMLRVTKDEDEKSFSVRTYFSENWDNALSSLVFIPVLLFLGHEKFNMGDVTGTSLEWKDAYYVCSGFAVDVVIVAWKKWKNK